MIRNRIHALLARQRGLEMPQVTDLFGARGRGWLATVRLPCEADQPLLEQDLEVLRLLEEKVAQADKLIGSAKTDDERLLESFPGIGPVFSAVIGQLSAYAGGLYRRGGGGDKRGKVDGRAAAKARGKNSNVAITLVAHRRCKILWCCLQERRPFTEEKPSQTFPDRSGTQMTVAAPRAKSAVTSHAPRR